MKYILKQKLPGHFKVGTIIDCDHYLHNNQIINVKDFPEFWEEVIEKDYEILSFIVNKNFNKLYQGEIITKQKDGTFKGISNDSQKIPIHSNNTEVEILKLSHWSIHSIKRLSDGEIFTIGDVFNLFSIDTYTISSFYVEGRLFIRNKEYNGISNLKHLSKIKPKTLLFKTEDGVNIFKGDDFYAVHKKNLSILDCKHELTIPNNWITFSIREKAEEYIIMNKPCLSIKEIFDNFGGTGIEEKLKALVNSKL